MNLLLFQRFYVLYQKDVSYSPFSTNLLLATKQLSFVTEKNRSHLGRCPVSSHHQSYKSTSTEPHPPCLPSHSRASSTLLLPKANLFSSALDAAFSHLLKDSAPWLSPRVLHYHPFSSDQHKNIKTTSNLKISDKSISFTLQFPPCSPPSSLLSSSLRLPKWVAYRSYSFTWHSFHSPLHGTCVPFTALRASFKSTNNFHVAKSITVASGDSSSNPMALNEICNQMWSGT